MGRRRVFTETHRRNMGIAHRGSRNGPAKLTERKVRAIDRRLRDGETIWELGKVYGVSHTAVWMIEVGRSWGWLTKRPNIGRTGRRPGRHGTEARMSL